MLLDIIVNSLEDHSLLAWLLGCGHPPTGGSIMDESISEAVAGVVVATPLENKPGKPLAMATVLMDTLLDNLYQHSVRALSLKKHVSLEYLISDYHIPMILL